MLEIVLAAMEHWPVIERVLARVWGEDDYVADSWRYWAQHPEEGMTLVALWDDEPVGTCHLGYTDNHTVWFHAMRIDPDYQGRGIAGAMNAFAIPELRRLGYRQGLAAIDTENIPSQKAATKSGFRHLYSYDTLSLAAKEAHGDAEECPSLTEEDAAEGSVWSEAALDEVSDYLELLRPHLRYPRDRVLIAWELQQAEEQRIKEALCWLDPEGGGNRCFFYHWTQRGAKAWAAIYDFDEGALIMSPACSRIEEWPNALHSLEAKFQKLNKAFQLWISKDDPLYAPTLAAGYVLIPEQGYQIWRLEI